MAMISTIHSTVVGLADNHLVIALPFFQPFGYKKNHLNYATSS